MLEFLLNFPAPVTHALAAGAGAILGGWITYRFSICLDRRRALVAIAKEIREGLLSRPSHSFHDRFSEADIDLFIRLLPRWKRGRFRATLQRYRQEKEKAERRDSHGGIYYAESHELHSSLEELIRFTDWR